MRVCGDVTAPAEALRDIDFMRAATIAFWLLIAAIPPLEACCISVTPRAADFFAYARSVFFARWEDAERAFRVEKVVRGDVPVGRKLEYLPTPCHGPMNGERYLATWSCREGGCEVHWTTAAAAPGLLRYLESRHRETHESVNKHAIRWQRRQLSDEAFEAWLETVASERTDEADVDFLLDLTEELGGLAADLRRLAKCDPALVLLIKSDDLRAAVALMRRFPAGPAEKFDRPLEEAEDDGAPWRSDYEDALMAALKNVGSSERFKSGLAACNAQLNAGQP